MNKKTNLIVLLSATAMVAAAAFAFSSMQRSFLKTRSDVSNYSITINPDDITTSTESTSGQVVVKTDQLKNNVKINFANVKRDGDNLVILEDGYIANAYDSQIRSIRCVNVSGSGEAYDYYLGWEAEGSTINYFENGYKWADDSDFDLSSFTPNYYKIAYRAVDVIISRIVIEFDNKCVVGQNPSIVKDGLKYRKVDDDHAILIGYAGAAFANVVVADTIDGLPVTEIADNAFYYNTTIESIDFGANVEKIGQYSFCYTTSLVSAGSFANITHVGYSAFQGAGSLTGAVNFTSKLVEVSPGAFMYTDITSLSFADTGNPYVADSAFRDDDQLVSVHIGSEMLDIYEDFLYDYKLETITVGAGNPKYSAVENVLFDNLNKTVRCIAANRAQTSFTVPEGYTLKEYCAYGNKTLESLTLGNATDRVPDYSFNYCEKLATINFGSYDGVVIQYAFSGCESLQSLTIPSNVNSVTQRAFDGCTNLKTVVFEEGCQKIEREAFKDCTSLNSVLLPTTLTHLGITGGWEGSVDVFEGCTALSKICTRLASGTYSGGNIIEGWNGGRDLAYESVEKNLDGHHWRMVDGAARVWGVVSVTFKVYRTDIGMGYGIYFLGTFNEWAANEDSRGNYVSDHWELTIELVSYVNYEFKGVVAEWDNPSNLVYEAGNNHSYTPDDGAFEYVINWQY